MIQMDNDTPSGAISANHGFASSSVAGGESCGGPPGGFISAASRQNSTSSLLHGLSSSRSTSAQQLISTHEQTSSASDLRIFGVQGSARSDAHHSGARPAGSHHSRSEDGGSRAGSGGSPQRGSRTATGSARSDGHSAHGHSRLSGTTASSARPTSAGTTATSHATSASTSTSSGAKQNQSATATAAATSPGLLGVAQTHLYQRPMAKLRKACQHYTFLPSVVAGGVAGCVSRTLTAPLDRIKVLSQEGRIVRWTMPHPTVMARPDIHPVEAMGKLARHVYYHEGGMKAFYRGNGVNCVKAGPEYAATFAAREAYLPIFSRDPKNPTLPENFVVGALGGGTAQSVLYPMELVKTRMAVSQRGEYNGIVDCISQAWRRGGVRDLYRGIGANLAGIMPHRGLEMGLFFSAESGVKKYWNHGEGLTVPQLCLTGCYASTVAQVFTYPLNLVRTRLQTQGVNGRPVQYTGIMGCFSTVIAQEGFRGLFAGILPNILKAVPASTLTFVIYREVRTSLAPPPPPKKTKQASQKASKAEKGKKRGVK